MKKAESSDMSLDAMVKPEEESSCRTSSRSIVSSNEDLMVNILSRLPVKVLSRFKCVSKQWNMLTSDPYFISAHHGRATQEPNIMKLLSVTRAGLISVCSIEEKEERKVTHDLIRPNYPDGILQKYKSVYMVGVPCNGWICLECVYHEGWRALILVCNPATRDTIVIPRGKKREYDYLELGLGFCSSSNEFKVVRFYEMEEGYGFELFTVGQRGTRGTHSLKPLQSWRHVGYLPYQICYQSGRMCHVNEKMHWIISPLSDSSSEYVLTLDLELEEFKVVSLPEDARLDFVVDLIDLGGQLCLVLAIRDGSNWLELWVLKDYPNSIWSKEYQIHVNISENPDLDSLKVIGIRWRRRLLLLIDNSTFCYYDPKNNSLEMIMEEHPGSVYVENLVIPF